MLHFRENTDVFTTLHENIYGNHSKKRVNIFYSFFGKVEKKNLESHLLHIWLGALRVNYIEVTLTLLLLNRSSSVLANSVDPDQLASEEAN